MSLGAKDTWEQDRETEIYIYTLFAEGKFSLERAKISRQYILNKFKKQAREKKLKKVFFFLSQIIFAFFAQFLNGGGGKERKYRLKKAID